MARRNAVERFLLAFPKRTWRKIRQLSPQERRQASREIAALVARWARP